jgi:NAD+ kinase
MKKLGIIANCGKPRAAEVVAHIAAHAAKLGMELYPDEPTSRLLGKSAAGRLLDAFDQIDALMALGGDGTMLRAVRDLDGRDKPVIGINIGSLGFLTSVAEGALARAMDCLTRGEFVMTVMAIAEIEVEGDGRRDTYRALNDVVMSSGPSGRMVTLDVLVDGDRVTSYACDGLIISTPAGSTGHSLSAGGPILMPETKAFVISLICPHTLSSRPLVVPDQSEITVRAVACSGELRVDVDGQVGRLLQQGGAVTVRRSDRNVRFVRLPGYSYFGVLRQKLHWSGSHLV